MWKILNHWLNNKNNNPKYNGSHFLNQGVHNVRNTISTEYYSISRGIEGHSVNHLSWNPDY